VKQSLQSSANSITVGDEKEAFTTTVPVLGTFGEGFYDPLTAKPRRIPLEVVQYDRITGTGKLSYSSAVSKDEEDTFTTDSTRNAILLKFDIPGLLAMNHPDKNLNGASSEFFCLSKKERAMERTKVLDGAYAPFGYVIEGLDIMDNLRPGDMISATYVDEWGLLNLVKIRSSSFADVLNSSNTEE